MSFRYINKDVFPALNAYIGLAKPGVAGSWQSETKVMPFLSFVFFFKK